MRRVGIASKVDQALVGLRLQLAIVSIVLGALITGSAGCRGACLREIWRAPRRAPFDHGAHRSVRRGSGRVLDLIRSAQPGLASPIGAWWWAQVLIWSRSVEVAARGKVNSSESCLKIIDTYHTPCHRFWFQVMLTMMFCPSLIVHSPSGVSEPSSLESSSRSGRCRLASMGRRRPLYDELVQAIRERVADANLAAATRWSDDMDQYYVEKTGESPMNREVTRFAASEQDARALADELLELGPEAPHAGALEREAPALRDSAQDHHRDPGSPRAGRQEEDRSPGPKGRRDTGRGRGLTPKEGGP